MLSDRRRSAGASLPILASATRVNGVRGKQPADAETPSVAKFDLDAFFGVATVVIAGKQPLTRLQLDSITLDTELARAD